MLTRWQPTARPVAWPSSHCHLPSGRPTPRARRPRVAHADPHAAWTNQRVPTLQPPMLVAVGSPPRREAPFSRNFEQSGQKMESKKIKRADSVLWRVSGREGPSSGGHYLCVCYIFYTLPRWTRWAKWGCIRARWAWHSSKHRLHSRWAATRVLPAAISSSTTALHRCVPCMGVHVCV